MIFYISIIVFVAIDLSITMNVFNNESYKECGRGCGLAMAMLPIISTWKFAFLMAIVAIIIKYNNKIDKTIKNTIYFLPIISTFSVFIIKIPVLWLLGIFKL